MAHLESRAAHEASFLGFLHRQFTTPKPLPPNTNLTSYTAIATGSNVGLGYEASRQLLSLKLSHLVMGVRNQEKGDAAATILRKEFPGAKISVWILDMESYDSVQAFSKRCEELERIDIVILNAGFMGMKFEVVEATGHEIMMQVNYLSTALLALLVIPILKAKRVVGSATAPVLSIVSSDAAFGAKIETEGPVLAQFDDPKGMGQFELYCNSKLLLVWFVEKLAGVVAADEVVVNISNPGMTKGTAFFRGAPKVLLPLVSLVQLILARSASVGASTYIDAVVGQGKASHGMFTSDWAIKPYPVICYTKGGKEVRERLWQETMEELDFAGVSESLCEAKTHVG